MAVRGFAASFAAEEGGGRINVGMSEFLSKTKLIKDGAQNRLTHIYS